MKKLLLALSIIIPLVADAGTLNIGTISPNSNVPAGTNITFQITPNTLLNARYTVSDDLPASTLSNSSINLTGKFDWTPTVTDIGTHNLVLTGIDSNGNRDVANQTLIVASTTALSIQGVSPSTTILPGKTFSLTVSAQGYSNPSFSVSDSFSGSSVSNFNLDTSGIFSWQPTARDVGVHNLSFRVTTPSGRNDVVYQTVTVSGIYTSATSYSTVVGTQLTINLVPSGLTSGNYYPSYRYTDSTRNNTIDNANINGNTFSWTPQAQDIGSHTVTISTKDLSGNYISIELNINVSPAYSITNNPTPTPPPTPVVTVSKFKFTKSLDLESKGTEVTELQKFLKTKGFYTGPITGYFGPLTKTAVKKFQKAYSISQLGNIGPATRAELNK